MRVAVELVGEETRTLEVPPDGTYADLLDPFDVTRHEVTVLVNGRPVPEDAPVSEDVERVRVVRLVKGG
jgi:sulfur carrier protein